VSRGGGEKAGAGNTAGLPVCIRKRPVAFEWKKSLLHSSYKGGSGRRKKKEEEEGGVFQEKKEEVSLKTFRPFERPDMGKKGGMGQTCIGRQQNSRI